MVNAWEHEVRLYHPDDEDHARLVPRRLIMSDAAVVAACTCGEWAREYGDSLAARTAWEEIAKHEEWHASLRPILDPLVIAAVAKRIRDRGGLIAPAECRYCHRRITCEPVGYPTWAANPADPAYPVLWCPDAPEGESLALHQPVEVTELVPRGTLGASS